MTALIIIGAIVLFFLLILTLKARLTVSYQDEIVLTLRILFIKIQLLPKKDKRKKVHSMSKKQAERMEKKISKRKAKEEEKKLRKKQEKEEAERLGKKKTLSDILDVITLVTKIAKAALSAFWAHLGIDVKAFKIKIATDDAASTAIAYGAVSQAVAYLFEFLSVQKKVRGLKKADTDISCDFLSDEIEADIKISFSLRVWHILHIGLAALIAFIKNKLSSDKKSEETKTKGESETENKNK